jgi:predicted nucleic acid-binding protein
VNWVDTPLLVYAAMTDHPAKSMVESVLGEETWSSSVLVMLELYQVLTRTYAVPPQEAAAAIEQFTAITVGWAPLDSERALATVHAREQTELDAADAHLPQLARDDHGTLVTLDRRLLRVARAHGVLVHNPIGSALTSSIADWEAEHLPSKGLGRFLSRTEQWLRDADAGVADRFVQATDQFTRLPL